MLLAILIITIIGFIVIGVLVVIGLNALEDSLEETRDVISHSFIDTNRSLNIIKESQFELMRMNRNVLQPSIKKDTESKIKKPQRRF